MFAVHVVAPYLLTAFIERPDRLIYLGSSMHTGGDASLDDLQWERRRWNSPQAYYDSKLHDTMLAAGRSRSRAGPSGCPRSPAARCTCGNHGLSGTCSAR